MAQPSPKEFQPYRKVQGDAEKELIRVLEKTAILIQQRILRLRPGVGGVVRASQLRLVLANIRRLQRTMWRNGIAPALARQIEESIKAGESALEALTSVAYTALNEPATEELLRSLRATAQAGLRADAARKKRDLSQAVYRIEALHEGKIEEMIRAGLISGLSAKELAKDVYDYVSPTAKGGASYAAMRLARTEINNAFHEMQIQGANRPGVKAVQWNLSGSHKVPDECNLYAEHKPYPPDGVPDKPHPQCFCYLTYIMQTPEDFLKALEEGHFDDEIQRRAQENMRLLGQKVGDKPFEPKNVSTPEPVKRESMSDIRRRLKAEQKAREREDKAPKAVEVPKVDDSSMPEALEEAIGRINKRGMDDSVYRAATDVLARQHDLVGDSLRFIKSVKQGHTAAAIRDGQGHAFGLCEKGHVTVRKDLHEHSVRHTMSQQNKKDFRGIQYMVGRDGEPNAILAHEMGHALLMPSMIKKADMGPLVKAVIAAFNLPDKADTLQGLFASKDNKEIIRRNFTAYAARNETEFIAEVWASFVMTPNDFPKVNPIGEIIRGIIRRRTR